MNNNKKIKDLEIQLKEKIKNSFSLGKMKYHYNNDEVFLLDGINSRNIKIKDLKEGQMIKLSKMNSVIVTGTPKLFSYIQGSYKWNIPCVKAKPID